MSTEPANEILRSLEAIEGAADNAMRIFRNDIQTYSASGIGAICNVANSGYEEVMTAIRSAIDSEKIRLGQLNIL